MCANAPRLAANKGLWWCAAGSRQVTTPQRRSPRDNSPSVSFCLHLLLLGESDREREGARERRGWGGTDAGEHDDLSLAPPSAMVRKEQMPLLLVTLTYYRCIGTLDTRQRRTKQPVCKNRIVCALLVLI